ncbi:MAG: hypothetical protein Q8N51_16350 [Gammaproteobacteria bacterium]|nr:hypothetical protein [Gammaproteobacteria bacterium]
MTSHGTASGLPGALRTITAPAVGAGTNPVITVPANTRWRLLGGLIVLSTSAAVANRTPVLVASASGMLSAGTRVAPVVANTVADYTYFTPGQSVAEFNTSVGYFDPMPPPILLQAADSIYCDITNLQGGDQVNGLAVYVEEWIDP